jgi:hypothetical protein
MAPTMEEWKLFEGTQKSLSTPSERYFWEKTNKMTNQNRDFKIGEDEEQRKESSGEQRPMIYIFTPKSIYNV